MLLTALAIVEGIIFYIDLLYICATALAYFTHAWSHLHLCAGIRCWGTVAGFVSDDVCCVIVWPEGWEFLCWQRMCVQPHVFGS